ncbi:hypothetical protein K227x_29570 [Rubripirellula lacrimiformis]|uniref:Uncharacterized protein n=1 Tax=Rubripirellula lacrimiformis TaxID=1930273 RepID=A0A517NBQ1_9BACT|nr:hypothetical protein [Rubripirellula lacrimiformis]QDT04565.1 hypothetical protein K227x_29570 [Rubripirellula lacrimiformis]
MDTNDSGETSVAGGSIHTIAHGRWFCAIALAMCLTTSPNVANAEGGLFGHSSNDADTSSKQRKAAIASLPMQRLTQSAQARIMSIVDSPTIYRRLPPQAIDCDQNMFLFLSRNPEVLVGMWDLMGITNVQIRRTGPYQLEAIDGSGTTCQIDLVYGDPHMHIFVASGSYDGKMVAKSVDGKGVFILSSRYSQANEGRTTVTGTIDCFLQLESLGADLIARTLSGLIGRSADVNFAETARFIAQVSQASEKNPRSMLDVASRLPQVDEQTRRDFAGQIADVARGAADRDQRVARVPQ